MDRTKTEKEFKKKKRVKRKVFSPVKYSMNKNMENASMFRATGPKSTEYTQLEEYIEKYYDMLKKKQKSQADRFLQSIRKFVLMHGCSDEDILSETPSGTGVGINVGAKGGVSQASSDHLTSVTSTSSIGTASSTSTTNTSSTLNPNGNEEKDKEGDKEKRTNSSLFARIGHELPTIRKVEDTLRGRLWRVVLGVSKLNANAYQNEIQKNEAPDNAYVLIRNDTKRTFANNEAFKSRVSEERLIRVLNSFVYKSNHKYCQGMDCIAGILLHTMPELHAFHTFTVLMVNHFPTYFDTDESDARKSLTGAYAGACLARQVIEVIDEELFQHLKPIDPWQYLFPIVLSFQTLAQPFHEVQHLWDFLFCFGVHLNPIVAAAQIIAKKDLLMEQTPNALSQGLLSQRKWLNGQLDGRLVVKISMDIICTLKSNDKYKSLWQDILTHTTNLENARRIKQKNSSTK
ncbi:rab domain-containing cell division control protein [Reticulomyxa filosa]|uniref:Rab domain-containing cell division control protein n=1 Tax=Reticulomyxa filosa TaxID=46433 RepID=X6NJM6_RETFI|nr:rab domain-containing cell division control protein [Reticulomyxa filosa]|eukprot:ETO26123.1 rab domain-containing cell division control protein [Reticulomyxa filosa]